MSTPRLDFLSVASGTVLDESGRAIESVTARALFHPVLDVDVEIASHVDSKLVGFHRRQNSADFEVMIGPEGAFRLNGPDPDRGTDGTTPSRFALEFEAPGFSPFVIGGLTRGGQGAAGPHVAPPVGQLALRPIDPPSAGAAPAPPLTSRLQRGVARSRRGA